MITETVTRCTILYIFDRCLYNLIKDKKIYKSTLFLSTDIYLFLVVIYNHICNNIHNRHTNVHRLLMDNFANYTFLILVHHQSLLFTAHHIITMYCIYNAVQLQFDDESLNTFTIVDSSNVLLSAIQFFKSIGYSEESVQLKSLFVLFGTCFFIGRVTLFPFYVVYPILHKLYIYENPSHFRMFYSACILSSTWFLQLYWFRFIVKKFREKII